MLEAGIANLACLIACPTGALQKNELFISGGKPSESGFKLTLY